MYCTKCGFKNDDEYNFCVGCGARLVGPSANPCNVQYRERHSFVERIFDSGSGLLIFVVVFLSAIASGALWLFIAYILAFFVGAGVVILHLIFDILNEHWLFIFVAFAIGSLILGRLFRLAVGTILYLIALMSLAVLLAVYLVAG